MSWRPIVLSVLLALFLTCVVIYHNATPVLTACGTGVSLIIKTMEECQR